MLDLPENGGVVELTTSSLYVGYKRACNRHIMTHVLACANINDDSIKKSVKVDSRQQQNNDPNDN